MFGWVAWISRYYDICRGGLSVYTEGRVFCTLLHCNIQEADTIVCLFFHRECHCGYCVVEKEIRKVINSCTVTIHKDEKWKYINLNPSTPSMKGLTKIHKTNWPIRTIINWQNAPAYKIAKLLSRLLQLYIPLPNVFNVKNSIQLINDLTEISIDKNTRLASFDIESMYSNVPTDELTSIIKFIISHLNIDDKLMEELILIP